MKLHTLLTISAILAAGFLCSCSQEPLPVRGDSDQVLMLSPALFDIQDSAPMTRALSENDLKDDQFNENKVARLDVFIFKTDGTFVKDYHTDNLTLVQRGGKEGYLLSSDWKKDGLDKSVAYKVYVVANSSNAAITTEGATTTEAALKALSTTDANIYKQYKEGAASDDVTFTGDKTFLMNATVASWTIDSMTAQLIGNETITLERAAVKFVMDVSLTDTFIARLAADNAEYGTPGWKFINFNTVTPELPEGDAVDANLSTRGSGAYLSVTPGESGHFIVTTYAYPQEWTSDTANDVAPAILLSYPALNRNTGTTNYHYYYIPLCENTNENAVTSTVRNKMYKVNAKISSYGSFETLTNDPVNLTYEVKDWTASSADVNAEALDYLLATPTRYSFKGGEVGEYLTETIHYYASGDVTITGVRAYYKNRTGAETTVTEGYSVGTPANGKIVVSSTVPTNGTFRTLEFTVNCADKSQKVIIRHYPSDFVTGISSSWCSYDDDTWAAKGVSGRTYRGSEQNNSRLRYQTSNDNFSATMYENGAAYYLNTNGTRGSQKSASVNNQMYVLQITSANDKYRIGRPNLVEHFGRIDNPNGGQLKTRSYYLSDDDVLSPAFMLASQLTRLSGTWSSVDVAALHCALYKEVDEDGNEYTGWRLPTKQEIQYMIDNQNTNTQVMIEVLSAQYYHSLDGGVGYNEHYTGGAGTYVRCVRDVTAKEIAKLNEF